jgi:hypothetical protein
VNGNRNIVIFGRCRVAGEQYARKGSAAKDRPGTCGRWLGVHVSLLVNVR